MENLTRYSMYRSIRECLKKNECLPLKNRILGISGIRHFYPFIDTENSELIEANYPEADIQSLQYENDYFDVLISDQVLEHIEDPNKAIEESFRVLKKKGLMIHTTCFINYYHPCPGDFWRFSPEALKFLSKNFSQILSCEGWGNRIAISLCFLADRFRSLKIPEEKSSIRNRLATYNEEKYPIVTWIIAKK